MKSYKKNDTIIGDGADIPNYVYFVLMGRCQMIESLQIETITLSGNKYFKLHDNAGSETVSNQKNIHNCKGTVCIV